MDNSSDVSTSALPVSARHVDVLEIFGGEAGVTRLCLRRQLVCGKNVDLVSGIDLATAHGVKSLWRIM